MNPNEISVNEANELQNKLAQTNQFFMPKAWLIQASTLAELLGINPDTISNLNGIRIYPGLVEATAIDPQNPSTPSPTLFLTKIDSKEFCTSRTAKPGPEVGRCSALRCRAEQKLSSTGTGISLQKTSAEARPAKANSPAE